MHNARSNEGERGRGGGRVTFKLTIHALERARLERLRSKQKKKIRIEPGEVGRLVERERESNYFGNKFIVLMRLNSKL